MKPAPRHHLDLHRPRRHHRTTPWLSGAHTSLTPHFHHQCREELSLEWMPRSHIPLLPLLWCGGSHILTVALDLLRKTQGRRRGTRRRRGAARSSRKLEHRLRGVMRTARRASNVEVPSFLRQLERPILEKYVSEGGSHLGLNYAVASMQGWRAQMEDAHACMPQLRGELRDWGYFAVFDGHAGTTVAQYCARHLLDHLLATGTGKSLSLQSGEMPVNAGNIGYGNVPVSASETAPLLMPEPASQWRPMTREELEAADGPGWRKVRFYLVLLFWLAWVATLATSVAIIIKSPRPVAAPLKWWQKSLFYQLQADQWTEAQAEGSEGIYVVHEQFPYLRSLGIGALILRGVFDVEVSPLNFTATDINVGTLAWMQHLLSESRKADLKIVLDLCELDLLGPQDVGGNLSAATQRALHFWLEHGVSGFVICDTDAAYSEKTLLEWRGVFGEFSSHEEERIVVVNQTADVLRPLNGSGQINITLVDVIIRSILPHSHHRLSTQEVASAIQTNLQTRGDDIWLSWTVAGKTSDEMRKLLLVLMMTLPGSPTIQDDNEMMETKDKGKKNRATIQLFSSLSFSRAREEALQCGSFTFLPFNTSLSSNSSCSPPICPPILAFLRSWGCVHFLVLLNVGPEPHTLDPAWASSLPEAGMFVASTGMDRFGSASLSTLRLLPYEAIVIKLFEAGSYS